MGVCSELEACKGDDTEGRTGHGRQEATADHASCASLPAYHKPQFIVSQECFNSPYGHVHFPVYAEPIGFTPGTKYDAATSAGESVKMLSAAAKEAGVWLLGGAYRFAYLARFQS